MSIHQHALSKDKKPLAIALRGAEPARPIERGMPTSSRRSPKALYCVPRSERR